MELGEKIRQARLMAGLSQRQLCGDTITRNMLSQIENGSARPSMETLRYLAARLGRPISYFLEEDVVTSTNQRVMERARTAYEAGDYRTVAKTLKEYRSPDPLFEPERQLLSRLADLALAKGALEQGRNISACQILEQLGASYRGYCAEELERQRILLLAKADPEKYAALLRELPVLDEELLLRARDALARGQYERSAALLDASENQESAQWSFLRGEAHMALQEYGKAAACYHRAEAAFPEQTPPRLERCYRELEDYKQAYFYACKQR